ncbi:hypothetical protein [Loktanella sp. S4079]|uniref:hypothetical protein n=1 Tax=Loktanella sp. S4079 TaxID=579483 RepID=UPI0005FA063E|nr:hypothetical protein [Loktanella sp. S4079]KJZ20615.1 hypothetical protein TW80_07535 [Loktanella sp. S4079]
MTALDKYERLECDGLWRADSDAQRRDVVVSFGNATLVITDGAGRPLTHWSLPAILRTNPGETPAIYAPGDDADETVEIADELMIDAIGEIQKALDKAKPKPGKLRHLTTAGLTALALGLAVFWLPGALTRQTLSVVPASKRTEIGATILGHMQATTGAPCREPRANAAATQLAKRLFGAETRTKIVVVPNLPQGAIAIPGRLILVDYALLQRAQDPAAIAGFIVASRAKIGEDDPLESVLTSAGLGVTFRLLTTGDIPSEVLQQNAQQMAEGAVSIPGRVKLRAALSAAQIPQAPYLALLDETTGNMPDLGNDPLQNETLPAILTDSEWVSLQNICNI